MSERAAVAVEADDAAARVRSASPRSNNSYSITGRSLRWGSPRIHEARTVKL